MKIKKRRQFKIHLLLAPITLLIVGAVAVVINQTKQADALSNFNPGNIMNDFVMSNYTSMTEAEIQAFLKSKNHCNDTNTSKAARYPHLRYNIRDGHFVCMADEDFNGESAAHIIWQAAQDYRINPQVLIVLLQKEQGLVTDTWPNHIQYRSATGYGCPDTAPCDAQYYGLKNQIRMAARLFRTVLDGGWTNYPVGENYVLYNPNRSCGGSVINIENRATSALYRYTPYQPNAGALAAGYGTAPCGAYGNRNFYLYFRDWFGSTQGGVSIVSPLIVKNIEQTDNVFTGQKIRFEYKIRNSSAQKQDLGHMIVIGRDEADNNYDVGYQRVILNPFEERVISGERIFTDEKVYNFSISNYRDGVGWDGNYPVSINDYARSIKGLFVQKAPTLVGGLESAPSSTHVDRSEKISLSIKNNSGRDLSTKPFSLVVKNESGDVIMTKLSDLTIPAGETKPVDYSVSISKIGKYSLSITNAGLLKRDNKNSAAQVQKSFNVAPSVQVTEGIKVSDLDGNQVLSLNKDKTYRLTVKLKNYSDKPQYIHRIGVGIRNSKDENRDPHHWPEVTIPANSEYVYEAKITPREVSTWRFWYSQTAKNYSWWNSAYPKFADNSIIKDVSMQVRDAVQVTEGIKVSDLDGNQVLSLNKDKTYRLTVKLKNYSDKPQYIHRIGVGIRNSKDENRDPHHWPEVTIPANSEYVYEAKITPREVSTWRFWYSQTAKNYSWWNSAYPKFADNSIIKDVSMQVR